MPRLLRIDLTRGEKHHHPDIKVGVPYLCKIGGTWYAGKFEMQWFGLNFQGVPNHAGYQYDTPGWNKSRWEEVHEIVDEG